MTYPPDAAVPMPDDITEATPQQFADWHAAESAYQTGRASHCLTRGGNPRAAAMAINTSNAAYAVSALTRALMEHAPDEVGEVVASIQATFVHGDAPEFVWEWLHAIGLDATDLNDAGIKAAKEQANG